MMDSTDINDEVRNSNGKYDIHWKYELNVWGTEGYWVFIDLYILHFDTVMCKLFSVCFFRSATAVEFEALLMEFQWDC